MNKIVIIDEELCIGCGACVDLCPKNIDHLDNFRASRFGAIHFDKNHLSVDIILSCHIDDFDDFDQPIQMFRDLFDDFVRARGHDRHARQRRIFGGCNGQAFDVIAARGKQTYDS